MAFERESAVLWLPGAFALEVIAWEVGSRLGLAIVDPSWEELGRSIQVEQIVWGIGAAVIVLSGLFLLFSRERSTLQLSLIQLLGVLAMACYWIGASVLTAGAVVIVATLCAWLLSRR
ncbi:MAG: hypothetical protein ACE37F_08640 [Nannocystaceae bacterium]|nr:hypothetical protein [bacterium]